MGLLSILRKLKEKEKELRFLILCVRGGALARRTRPRQVMRLEKWPPPATPPPPTHTLPPCFLRDLSGLDNAGKTTVLKKFSGEDISTISPTLGFSIQTLEYAGYSLNVWDVGGQRTIRAYWRNYFEATDALIWVVDSADRRRLADCREELRALLGAERLAGATLLVLANKQDMRGALPAADIATALGLAGDVSGGGDCGLGRRHWAIMPCSAVTGEGLVAAMDWLVADVASRVFTGED